MANTAMVLPCASLAGLPVSSASAQIVQVILPKDCLLQSRALQSGLRELNGPATLVSGIGPGAVEAMLPALAGGKGQAQLLHLDIARIQLLPQRRHQGSILDDMSQMRLHQAASLQV